MAAGNKSLRVGVLVVIVLIIGGVTYYRQMSKMTTREITGRVLAIDVASRKAAMEFTHPKTGKTFQLDGHVPPECDIQIDGKPAQLTDLKVGETIDVFGTLYRNGNMEAKWVKVSRTASQPSPAPSSSPAATQPG